jgi:hypothetical protein
MLIHRFGTQEGTRAEMKLGTATLGCAELGANGATALRLRAQPQWSCAK